MSNDQNDPRVEMIQRELRDLPALNPPADVWARIQTELDAADDTKKSRSAVPAKYARLALAASVAMVTTMGVFFTFNSSVDEDGLDLPRSPFVVNEVPSAEIAHLLERSRNAERRRRSVPTGVRLVADRALPDAYAPRILRTRIADVDATMNRLAMSGALTLEERERLLRRRVELMESLVRIEQERLKASLQQVTY